MGFTPEEVRRLNFKVQAGNVIDADLGNYWYQSKLENLPAVLPRRILTQYNIVTSNVPSSFANLLTLVNTGALNGIVENGYGDPFGVPPVITSTRLTRVGVGFDNTWVAWNTYNTPSSGRKDLWVSPPSVPDSSGNPTSFYEVVLYSGDPDNGGVSISTSVGQGSGANSEAGWVWNYSQGLLFLSNVTILS